MAVPILNLNLAPRPSLWRQRHVLLGWVALGIGGVILAGAIGFTWRAYHQADRAGRAAVSLTEETKRAARQEQQIQASLLEIDVAREGARWKLAERILQERSLPWSRLTTELEQCMAPDMRLVNLQRTRGSAQQVVMKLKGEARTRQAEAAFVEALRNTPVFAQVTMERESERVGGGWDFEITLPTATVPPPFQAKALKLGPASPAPIAPVKGQARPSIAAPRAVAAPGARIGVGPTAIAVPSAPSTHPAATPAHVMPPPSKAGQEALQPRPTPTAPTGGEEPLGRRSRPPRGRPNDPGDSQ
jgi:Tfp pilus assembly protein PilN